MFPITLIYRELQATDKLCNNFSIKNILKYIFYYEHEFSFLDEVLEYSYNYFHHVYSN